jgi:NADH-quinone oxidoreductase subunit L
VLMRVPMIALAVGAVAAGLLGLSSRTGAIQTFLEPVFGAEHGATEADLSEFLLSTIASVVALVGLGVGLVVYASRWVDWTALRVRLALVHTTLAKGFFIDDAYGALLVLPGKAASAFLAYVFDQRVIDGAVNGLGDGFRRLAGMGRRVQTGLVRSYALAFLLGAVALVLLVVVRS